MRFQRLAIAAFGPLQQRSFAVDSDLVLVCGPNEAGKSSLRAAIETLLFGFRPADREQHPLARWDPDRPQSLELACALQLVAVGLTLNMLRDTGSATAMPLVFVGIPCLGLGLALAAVALWRARRSSSQPRSS